MKVVRCCESSASGTCQKPFFVSRVEKTVAPASFAMVSSTVGKTKASRWTEPLSFFRSTQILTSPFFFRTVTIGAHHSVGSVTGSMMPASTILASSPLTFCSRGNGTRRATGQWYGVASGRRRMWTGGPSMQPSGSVLLAVADTPAIPGRT